MTHGPWQWPGRPLGLLRIEGPDAADFLHRLSSQDVAAMRDREVRPTAFLNPKGRLLALAQTARLGSTFLLAAEAARTVALHELLERYHFTEKLQLARPEPAGVLLAGPGSAGLLELEPGHAREAPGGVALAWQQHGIEFAAWLSEAPAPWTPSPAELAPADAELLRLLAGMLRHGVDYNDTTLGPEAPIENHLSHTKGCYTGQEIVARIATYGHVNRRIVLLDCTAAPQPAQSPVVDPDDGEPVGRILSSTAIAGTDGSLALAVLPAPLATAGSELRAGDARAQVVSFGPPAASAT